MNEDVDEFVRAALLDVMGQLYLDGVLEENEWKAFIKQNVYNGEECNYVYVELATVICECHFIDMLPEIRYMQDNDLMDEMCLGKYDSCVDYMFRYEEDESYFCKSPMNAADMLKNWAMFEGTSKEVDNEKSRKDFEKLMKQAMRKGKEQEKIHKVGRNDPCPCGSGKKYKLCCLNRPKSQIDSIESATERKKWLKSYPYIGEERLKDRIYLEDYFDSESIEIDKLLYLGLMNRPGAVWDRDENKEENRKRQYLSLAFGMFMDKIKKEDIQNFEEYNQKFSIHYRCEEWLGEFVLLLKKSGNEVLHTEVMELCKKMSNKQDGFVLKQKWKEFDELTEKCYNNMIESSKDGSCWLQAFELLKDIIYEERQKDSKFASQLELVDEVTDYVYDIQSWLEDCLDEIEERGQYEVLLKMCDDLLQMFSWPEYTGSAIKFRKSVVLRELGRKTEAVAYCKEWIQSESENMFAATALVYAFIEINEFGAAKEVVEQFIYDESECTEENDILFMAASKLYGMAGDSKKKREIDKAIQEYEEYLEEEFEDLEFDEGELPFN